MVSLDYCGEGGSELTMTQDLSGKNLQGQSFRGQNLRGANFSNADIRGADFSYALLTGANFSQARGGLQLSWAMGLGLISLGLSACAGCACAFAGAFPHYLLAAAAIEQYTVVPGVMVLVLFLTFSLMLLWRGVSAALMATAFVGILTIIIVMVAAKAIVLTATLAKVVAIALTLAGVVATIGIGVEAAAGVAAMVLSLFFMLIVAVIAAFILTGWLSQGDEATLALVLAMGGTVAGAGAFAVAGVFGTAFGVAGMIVGASGTTRTVVEGDVVLEAATGLFVVTTAILLAGSMAGGWAAAIAAGLAALGVHIGRRSLLPGRKFQLVRHGVLALTSAKGTRFCQADLSKARFSKAILPCTDFSGANIQDTLWAQAIQLRRAHFDQTILPSPSDTH